MAEAESCGRRYLSSKKTVDDRALNRGVIDRLRAEIATLGNAPVRVMELGAGLGTMVGRLADWRVLTRAEYRLVDVDGSLLREARAWLLAWATERGLAVWPEGEGLRAEGQGIDLLASFAEVELSAMLARPANGPPADLIIANAFLDLVDVPAVLPALFQRVAPGGLYYFSINFDGETIFLPEHPADEVLMAAYHRSMDERVRFGRPAGESRAGRRLFGHLAKAGASVLAAGASDWLVHPRDGRYPADEAFFLHTILDTVAEALGRRPDVDQVVLAEWLGLRRRQVERAELIYLAHQLDFMGRCPR